NVLKVPLSAIVRAEAPGPMMLMFLETYRLPELSWIVDGLGKLKTMLSPFMALPIAARKLPAPLSEALVTVKILGRERSSSASRRSRMRLHRDSCRFFVHVETKREAGLILRTKFSLESEARTPEFAKLSLGTTLTTSAAPVPLCGNCAA